MPYKLHNYFLQNKNFKLSTLSIVLFLILGIGAWLMNIFAQIAFPTQSLTQHFARTVSVAVAVLIVIAGSTKLFKKNNIPPEVLGLKLSAKSFFSFILGGLIGTTVIASVGLILYFFVPYHFEMGPLKAVEIIKIAHSYFWGNFLEELIFRGYPLIILSQLFGWRKAVWILALPFGLFHLPGVGFGMEALKMITTTATFSFVFSYTFILTRTLWTAVGAHVISNIILHISGLDGLGRGIITPVFDAKWPVNYDPGFFSFLICVLIISFLSFLLIKKRFQAFPITIKN